MENRMSRVITLLIMLLTLVSTSFAQSLSEIDKRDAAVVEAWQATPLTVRHAVFVSEHPAGFGMYKPRASDSFKPGEKLTVYAEPIGYGWKHIADGLFEFGFVVDFLVKSPDGKILAGNQNFARLVQQSHVRNREFMLTLNLDLTGANPGDYVLEYTLHDISSDKSTSFELPFKIAK
jgi:hypothetical protein